MTAIIEFIPEGTVTSPRGFSAGATYAGIKKDSAGALDLGVLTSEIPPRIAALFTTNSFKAAPVTLSQQRFKTGRAAAVVVNSGCANAGTGEAGLADATEMAALAADKLGLGAEQFLVASTGIIGQRLPMKKIRAGIAGIVPSAEGGHQLARAMMTTDTVPKEVAVAVTGEFTIGGAAKGSGMIHPQMATMLCFLTTDANVEAAFLAQSLARAADLSLNMVSVDGDTSPNDMLLVMANGKASGEAIGPDSPRGRLFQQALEKACIHLARAIASDGEGATRLIEVTVKGAVTDYEARRAARTVVSSPLVKTAVHGNDPNWGRILAAAGRSGAELEADRVDIYIDGIRLVAGGAALPFDAKVLASSLGGGEVNITIDLNLGAASATAWGCDLSAEYVAINSEYTT
jgi:glutamate N-acetyltransferase/amino-acid N-acetyltransferase